MKNNRRILICFASTFLISFSVVQGQAQSPSAQNRSTITGYVSNPQRNPVSQIPVELINEVNRVIGRTKTDGSGRFFFNGVGSGRFSIRVLPFGTDLEEQTQEIEISGVSARGLPIPENVQIDFSLHLRKNSASVAGRVLFAQEIPEEAKKLYENAVSDLEDKRAAPGIEGLQKAVKIFPTYYLALERLGLEYINQRKYEDAQKVFSQAVTVNPRSFSCWYGLSYANYSMQRPEAAIEAAKQALALDRKSVTTLFLLGVSQRQIKRYEEAEQTLMQAKKLDKGKTPDIYWNLALLYAHNLKRFNDAANELELYLKADPNAPNSESVKKLIKQFREKFGNN